MINTNKLRGKIIEQGYTIAQLAEIMGMSPCTLGRKVRNISDMTLAEAESIREILGISVNRMTEFFFTDENHDRFYI